MHIISYKLKTTQNSNKAYKVYLSLIILFHNKVSKEIFLLNSIHKKMYSFTSKTMHLNRALYKIFVINEGRDIICKCAVLEYNIARAN